MAGPVLTSITPAANSAVLPSAGYTLVITAATALDAATLVLQHDGITIMSAGVFVAGSTGSVTYTTPESVTIVVTTHPAWVRLRTNIIVTIADTAGPAVTLRQCVPYAVIQAFPTALVAQTHCAGKRIDLSWTNPAGATRLRIRRSVSACLPDPDDTGATTVYEGAPITAFVDGVYTGALDTSNTALQEGVFYYYTVFVSYSAAATYVWLRSSTAEVTGLAAKDYNTREGHYLYALLPREYRRADEDPQRGTDRYALRDYCSVLQCGVNIQRAWLEGLLLLKDPDLAPAGLVGTAENQRGVLSAHVWEQGYPAGQLEADVLRRLALSLASITLMKGSCGGLTAFATALTGWSTRCDDLLEPLCGVERMFFTWDGDSHYLRFEPGGLTANDGDVSVAGQVTLRTARTFAADGTTVTTLSSTAPIAACVLDAMGTFACVASVAAPAAGLQAVVFTSAAATLRKEITGTGVGGVGTFNITSIDAASYPWQFPSPLAEPEWGTNAWEGYELMDAAGVIYPVLSSVATDALGETLLNVTGNPGAGAFSLAKKFDPAGATYGTRLPLLHARVFVGQFSLTYDPKHDHRLLADGSIGPWSLLTALGSTTSRYFGASPDDVVLWADGVHHVASNATAVSQHVLTDSTKAWSANQWQGYYLLPNWNQSRVYRISGNTATQLIVDGYSGGGLPPVASVGAPYVVLSELAAVRYSRLMRAMPSFIPLESRGFVKFEGTALAAPAAPAPSVSVHDPATDNLSVWLRTDSVSGSGITLAWASKASAGTSGAAAAYNHNTGYGDTVTQPSTALDGYDSVVWTAPYPLLESIDRVRALLGAGDSTPASYTVAYVVQPVSSGTYGLDGGGKVAATNPTIWGDPYGYLTHAIMNDAGTCKVGVHHQNEDAVTDGGTTPAVWPGGFGAWGLMWVSYTSGGNVRIRINGVDLVDETIVANQGPAVSDQIVYMGTLGGGAYAGEFRLVEMMVFPGQALTGAALTLREQGYFKTRYPSLGL
jgi:hypothetical protein